MVNGHVNEAPVGVQHVSLQLFSFDSREYSKLYEAL